MWLIAGVKEKGTGALSALWCEEESCTTQTRPCAAQLSTVPWVFTKMFLVFDFLKLQIKFSFTNKYEVFSERIE